MGTCGQPGYVFREFCLERGIEFIIFCLNQGIDLSIFVLNWVKCLKQGIKNWNSVLKWVGKSAIFVLNRVRVWGAAPHLPGNQGYIEYPPPPPAPGGGVVTQSGVSLSAVSVLSNIWQLSVVHHCQSQVLCRATFYLDLVRFILLRLCIMSDVESVEVS